MMHTQINGQVKRQNDMISLDRVGHITSKFPLDTQEFEIVTLEFDEKYTGVDVTDKDGGSILTFSRNQGVFDQDIVSPIVLMTSGWQHSPVNVLSCGTITSVLPVNVGKTGIVGLDGMINICVVTPGKTLSQIRRYYFVFPQHIRFDRKIIHIKKFDLYIFGGDIEELRRIMYQRTLDNMIDDSIIGIRVSGDNSIVNKLFYRFCGVPGEVTVFPTASEDITISVRIIDQVFTETIPIKRLLNLEDSIRIDTPQFSGVDVLFDTNQDRLSDNATTSDRISGSIDAFSVIKKLQKEKAVLEYSNDTLTKRIKEAETKFSEIEVKLKVAQELNRQRQEERKAETQIRSENIKLAIAAIGVITVIVTAAPKVISGIQSMKSGNSNGVANFIGWSFDFVLDQEVAKTATSAVNAGGSVAEVVSECASVFGFF